MNRILKSTILGVAVAATSLASLPAAQADDHWRRHYRHRDSGDALAAGLAGLAVGAIVGGASISIRRRRAITGRHRSIAQFPCTALPPSITARSPGHRSGIGPAASATAASTRVPARLSAMMAGAISATSDKAVGQ